MSYKSLIAGLVIGLLSISCNSSTFIEVDTGSSLELQDVSIVDYDFTTSTQNGNERIYFEFVTNRELDSSTIATFTDQGGNIIARGEIGNAVNEVGNIDSPTESQSYVYSMQLGEIRSLSLIYGVQIGN